jgi:hypothetical protein
MSRGGKRTVARVVVRLIGLRRPLEFITQPDGGTLGGVLCKR